MRRLLTVMTVVGLTAAASIGAMSVSGAASGTGSYVTWAESGTTGSGTFAGTYFPDFTVTRTNGSWQVPSGASAWLSDSTPFGAAYGSSRDKGYLAVTQPLGGQATVTTITFESAPTAGTWGFALGDADAENLTISATDIGGNPLDPEAWLQSAFNYCAVSPKPSSCPAGTHTDQPTWNSPVLTGSGNDTFGAAAWFKPTASLKTLTITQARNVSGAPVYQLWIAADIIATPTPSASATPSATSSPSPSPSPSLSASATASTEASASESQSTTPDTTPPASPTPSPDETVRPHQRDPIIVVPNEPTTIDVIEQAGADPDSMVSEVETAQHGTTTIVDNMVVYTPDVGYRGKDQIVAYVTEPNDNVIKVALVVETGRAQTPLMSLGLPHRLGRATTTLIDHVVVTNAHQTARVRVTCVPVVRTVIKGDPITCLVSNSGGRIAIRVVDTLPVRVRVVVSAPEKGKYASYRVIREYLVRPTH